MNNSSREPVLIAVPSNGGITIFSKMPASLIPFEAKKNGKKIIEINVVPSNYTSAITDVFLQGKATIIMEQLLFELTGQKV